VIVRENQIELSTGWTFQFEDEDAHPVSLPHCWNALDTMDTDPTRHFRRGRGTYTLDFVPPDGAEGRRVWLHFGAVAQRGWVYFDDTLIGEHHGGYTAFTVEIPNRAGQLRVVADNTPDIHLIPSDLSDFFLYGGITRPVTLFTTGSIRLERTLFDITTTADRATMTLRTTLDGPIDSDMRLHVLLYPPGEPSHAIYEESYHLDGKTHHATLPDVEEPILWSTDDPQLYRVVVRLIRGGEIVDAVEQHIGFRWFDFPDGGPFYLNGDRLLLKGTHRHDDWAGYGAAVPRHLIRQEMEQVKATGFNFIRLGHYPQDDYTLHLCDTLGLIVWEELPWCRGGLGGDVFKNHARNMLHEMIDQHYNHPSVIFWGLGNELDWESEHPDSDDNKVADFLSELHNLSHQLDPSRLTALRRFEPGAAIVDVYSPSIWSGWYRGRYQDYETVLQQAIERYPRLLHIEWGGDSHVGRHNDGPHIQVEITEGYDHSEVPGTAVSDEGFARYSRDGDWSESYIIDLMAHHLAVQARLPQLAGMAQWVYKDFGTPLRPENAVPYVNQKGLVARDGKPKDVYYVFQAFQCDNPVVRIESSGWPLRVVDEPSSCAVRVISNCEHVELLVDGQSQGEQPRGDDPATVMSWQVGPLTPGDHTFEAVGYRDGQVCARHTITQQVALGNLGPVAGMSIEQKQHRCVVQLVDTEGRPVTTDERRIHFSGEGIARFGGVMGYCDVVETANGRAWIACEPGTVVSVEML
jgi:beta-galactosidase